MTKPLRIVLAAGGTGGHVFPAVAAAEALQARGHRVIVATDGRGARFEGDIETARIAASGLSGGVGGKLKGALRIGLGVFQSLALLLRTRADVVVGFGGYPSLPPMLAAMLLKRPTLLHEQNAVLGRVNRLLARRGAAVAAGVAAPAGAADGTATLVGNPVRRNIAAIAGARYAPSSADEAIELLIFGGSQGARILSAALPGAVTRLPDAIRARLRIAQQCRPEDLDEVAAAYRAAGVSAHLKTFFDDMPDRLETAHLVVARSGASTVAELAAAGRPSLLIPFAAAMDDHQTANAMALVDAGAAWRIAEADATPDLIAARLATILADPDGLARAAEAALGLARPNAAEHLADLIETVAEKRAARANASLVGGIAA